ncbi:MAG: hypothetical protein QM763_07985 [Agriterribacter sp.]
MLLAVTWKVFGVSIIVSHLMMLPFLILLINQVYHFTRFYFKENWAYISAMILFNPIILGQSTLISPDVVLIAFFFFTLNGILYHKKVNIIIGAIVLGGISMRGMMCIPYLYLFSVLREKKTLKKALQNVVAFLPGVALVVLFLIFHYRYLGWIGYHKNSPWAESFERVGFQGFVRNIVVFGWRMVDMGLIFLWGILFVIILKNWSGFHLSKRTKDMSLLLLLCFFGSVLIQLFYRYSLLHRYLFPLISIIICIFGSITEEYTSEKSFKKITVVAAIAFFSANFWVFPDRIAKGWDATLAHLPYYKLRCETLNYIKQHNIPLNQISAAFPYDMERKYIDLRNDTSKFSALPPEETPYTLYSNIANQYSDDQLLLLKTKFIPVYTFGGWPVRFILYKNPEYR